MEGQLEPSSSSLSGSNSNCDWRLNPNIPIKIEQEILDPQFEAEYEEHHQNPVQNNLEINAEDISPNCQQFPQLHLHLTPSSSSLLTLCRLLPLCDLNCYLCEKYIVQLSQHIINGHGQGQRQGQGHTVNSTVTEFNHVTINNQNPNGLREETEGHDDGDQNIKLEFEDVYSDDLARDPENSHNMDLVTEGETQEFDPINMKTEIEAETSTFDRDLSNLKTEIEADTLIYDLDPEYTNNPGDLDFTDNEDRSGDDQDSKSDIDFEPKLESNKTTEKSAVISNLNCKVCNARFHHIKTLTNHLRTAHVDDTQPAFTCSQCEERFFCKDTMICHIRRVHPEQNTYACRLCDGKFTKSIYLKWHIQTVHTRKKPNVCVCETCGKNYTTPKELTLHRRTHTVEKPQPHKCETCGKSFSKRKSLTEHEKIHIHTGEKEKSYICEQCGRGFLTKTQLICHSKIHTGEKPYKCSICGESYLFPRQLALHEKIHAGEKSNVHECEKCGKYFSSLRFLNVHVLSHRGEKQFECGKCNKSFKFRSNLITHCKIHTGEKS